MCLAENRYYPACGCWVGHEVISPCIRRHGGIGGKCRELVIEGVLRKPGRCLPCRRKDRPQLSAVGRQLSSFMTEINESARVRDLEYSIERRKSLNSISSAETLVTPEPTPKDNWHKDTMYNHQSLESNDSLALLDEEESNSQQVQADGDVNQYLTLSRYLQLYSPSQSRSWYHVAAGPPSPFDTDAEEWEMEGEFLLGGPGAEDGDEEDKLGQAVSAEARRKKRRCCGCVPS